MRRQLRGKVVFHHIDGSNNQLTDWLARVTREVGKEVDMLGYMAEGVTLLWQPPWPFKEASRRLGDTVVEHVHSVSKAVGGTCLPQPSVETGGGCLTIIRAVAALARRCCGVGKVGLDFHGNR